MLMERLKIRLQIQSDSENLLLYEILESAQALFLSVRYPVTPYPTDERGNPVVDRRWEDWILRAAVEMYAKIGAEGQTGSSENGITRNYETGTVSKSLLAEITPVAGIVR